MARRPKNVALDRAQEKAKKQKKLAIVLCGVLALVLVFEVPKTLKLMSSGPKAPVVEASASTPPAPNATGTTSTPAAAGPASSSSIAASTSSPAQSIVASVPVKADTGQLTEFARFASKDPFLQSVQKSGAAAAPSSTPASKTAAPPKTKAAAPKTPPAPPPTTAVISINGELVSVTVDTDFPTAGAVFSQAGAPLFHLVSLTTKTAKVAIAGGSYADGAPTLTLTVGKPVTLQNTADGTRYTLLLEPQGTQVPTSTTPTTTTTAAASVVPSSGG